MRCIATASKFQRSEPPAEVSTVYCKNELKPFPDSVITLTLAVTSVDLWKQN